MSVIRVASWPHWYGPNPYLRLLYRALAPHGIEHVSHAPLDPDAYAGRYGLADFVHLHWAYPLWREPGGGQDPPAWRIRGALDRLKRIRAHGVGLIWTVHNLAPHDGLRRGEADAYAALHDLADLRVFHSESARREAEERHGPGRGDRVVVRHGNWDGALPVPAERSSVLRREGLPPGVRLLLCFGQVRAYKGFDLAVQAVRGLESEGFHLAVVGRPLEGEGRRLRRLARGASNVTLLLEQVDDRRLADLLGAADAVLLPYRSVTGSGAALHALTAGRGLVATDLPYFREVLAPEPDAAVLVPPGSEDALAEGIRAFFGERVEERGRAARRLADRYAWPVVVAPLVRWLRQSELPKRRRQRPGAEGAGSGGTP